MSSPDALNHRQFDDSPHLEHFLKRRTCNERTAIRLQVGKPFVRQLRERLTHRAALDRKHFA